MGERFYIYDQTATDALHEANFNPDFSEAFEYSSSEHNRSSSSAEEWVPGLELAEDTSETHPQSTDDSQQSEYFPEESTDDEPPPKSIDQLIEDLASDDFETRERATQDLIDRGPEGLDRLIAEVNDRENNPEVRSRAKNAIDEMIGKSVETSTSELKDTLVTQETPAIDQIIEEAQRQKQEFQDKYRDPDKRQKKLDELDEIAQRGDSLTDEQRNELSRQRSELENFEETLNSFDLTVRAAEIERHVRETDSKIKNGSSDPVAIDGIFD